MHLRTTRFGALSVEPHDLLNFPNGLIGFEECRQWLLLCDAGNDALGWLQSVARPETALPIVSPRRFVPDYRFRIYRSALAPLELATMEDAQVLTVVGRHDGRLTLNLKAPIVINLRARLGRQLVTNDDQPLQHVLSVSPSQLKMTA